MDATAERRKLVWNPSKGSQKEILVLSRSICGLICRECGDQRREGDLLVFPCWPVCSQDVHDILIDPSFGYKFLARTSIFHVFPSFGLFLAEVVSIVSLAPVWARCDCRPDKLH